MQLWFDLDLTPQNGSDGVYLGESHCVLHFRLQSLDNQEMLLGYVVATTIL